MDIKRILGNKKFDPDPLKDQFFLIDDNVAERLVGYADLCENDTVLEIGTGFGNITDLIAKNAKKVISFEIDKRFRPYLKDLPENVDLRFTDAWDYVRLKGKFKKKKEYNKIISNLPYSFCEKLLHNLTFLEYDRVILLVPLKFVNTIRENRIFGSFFICELKETVSKNSFYPKPRTNSAIIDLVKIQDPVETKNISLFLRQYIYQHEEQKTKNSLREGLIKFYANALHKNLTKNQARNIIQGASIDQLLLEQKPLDDEIYRQVGLKLSDTI